MGKKNCTSNLRSKMNLAKAVTDIPTQLELKRIASVAAPVERSDNPVPITNLSDGEQEQLFLAARLALATVLAKETNASSWR